MKQGHKIFSRRVVKEILIWISTGACCIIGFLVGFNLSCFVPPSIQYAQGFLIAVISGCVFTLIRDSIFQISYLLKNKCQM